MPCLAITYLSCSFLSKLCDQDSDHLLLDNAVPLIDLQSILTAATVKDRLLSLKDCYFYISSHACRVDLYVLPDFCNGKVSFSTLISKIIPNFDIAPLTNDLIVHGKYDCTFFSINHCKLEVSFYLVSRELLDVIPSKIRLIQSTISLNISYDEPSRQSLSELYIGILGYMKVHGLKIEVSAVKKQGTTDYNVTMVTRMLEIADFMKLFTDADNLQNGIPTELTWLLSFSLRSPRISGLYAVTGAYEFVASAETPASIFPSRPTVYVIVQKPRLGRVVTGLIASFRDMSLRRFLSSLMNQDLSSIPLITDMQTNLVLGISTDGLYVVKDELFNKDVGSVIASGRPIKQGLSIKAILPFKNMLAVPITTEMVIPDNALINLKVTDRNITVEFSEDARLNVMALSKLFHVKGQEIFPPNDYINAVVLNMKKYVVDLKRKTLSLSCTAPSLISVGNVLTLLDVEASLSKNELGKWSFSINGSYMLGNTLVDVNIQATATDGYKVSSVPTSVRYSLLLSMVNKQPDLQRELDQLHLGDFVVDNMQILGNLGNGRDLLRYVLQTPVRRLITCRSVGLLNSSVYSRCY